MSLKLRPRPAQNSLVTSHWPLAQAYGAQQRVLNLGRLLNRFGDVSVVIVTPEHEAKKRFAEPGANAKFVG